MGSWTSSYITGVPLMDTQHKELFRHMDELVDKANAHKIPEIIDFLGKYVDKHFREEQNLHASCLYPQREAHKKLHADFVASYKKLKEDYKKMPGKEATMGLKISRTAVDWLKNHIHGPDRMFAKFYFTLPGHVKPPEANLGPDTTHPHDFKLSAPHTGIADAGHSSSWDSHPRAGGADAMSEADGELLRRISTRALANELIRRAELSESVHSSPTAWDKPAHP